jgi:hypothetical protein
VPYGLRQLIIIGMRSPADASPRKAIRRVRNEGVIAIWAPTATHPRRYQPDQARHPPPSYGVPSTAEQRRPFGRLRLRRVVWLLVTVAVAVATQVRWLAVTRMGHKATARVNQ